MYMAVIAIVIDNLNKRISPFNLGFECVNSEAVEARFSNYSSKRPWFTYLRTVEFIYLMIEYVTHVLFRDEAVFRNATPRWYALG